MKKQFVNTATLPFMSLLKVVEETVANKPVVNEFYQTELEKELAPHVPVGFTMFVEEKIEQYQHVPNFDAILGYSIADHMEAPMEVHAQFTPFCYKRGDRSYHRYIRITVVADAYL